MSQDVNGEFARKMEKDCWDNFCHLFRFYRRKKYSLGTTVLSNRIKEVFSGFEVPRTTFDKWELEDSPRRPVTWQQLAAAGQVMRLSYRQMDRLFELAGLPDLRMVASSQAKKEEMSLLKGWIDKTICVLPQEDIPDFVGRVDELEQLEQQLLNSDDVRMVGIAGVVGTGGIGKSALAIHFARKYQHYFPDGIIGLTVDHDTVDVLAQKFASHAGEEVDPSRYFSTSEIMQRVFQQKRMLLILDGAEEATIRQLLPGKGECSVIVTSRNHALLSRLGISPDRHINLSRFTEEETHALLSQILGSERVEAEREQVKELHKLMGGLPLALRIVGGTLGGQWFTNIGKYVDYLREEKLKILEHLQDSFDAEVSVRASFRLSLRFLKEEEKQLFACLGACAPEGYSAETAQVVSGQQASSVRQGLAQLYNLSLVNQGMARRLVLHPLLFAYARELGEELGILTMAEQRHTEHFVAYAERYSNQSPASMDALVKELDALVLTGGRLLGEVQQAVGFYLVLEPLLQRRGHWSRALGLLEAFLQAGIEQRIPLIVAHTLLQKGQFLALLARYSEAELVLLRGKEVALQIEDRYQQRHVEAMLGNSLGGVYQAQGRLKEAEEALHESLVIGRELEDKRHVAIVLNTLGGVYQAQGRLKEAEGVLRESLDLDRELGNKRGMGMALNTLGSIYQAQRRLKEAEEVLHESLLIGRELENKRHIAIVLNTLGGVYQKQRRLKEAEGVLRESLNIEQELGNKKGMGMVLNTLGGVYQAQKRLREAEEALRESVLIGRELEDKIHLRIVLNTLGGVYQAQKRLREAEEALRESLLIGRELENKRHIAIVLNTLGGIYQTQGRLREAEEALRESVLIGKELEDKIHLRMVLNTLGAVYQKQGRLKEAEEVLCESVLIGRELEDKRHLRMVLNTLGVVYYKQEKLKEAEQALCESLLIQEEQGDKRGIGMVLNTLGAVYQKQERSKEAEEALRESLLIGRELEDKRHMAIVLKTLGEVYHEQGKLKEAEEVLREGLLIQEGQEDKRGIGMVLNTLGPVYQAQGRLEEAEMVLRRALKIYEMQVESEYPGIARSLNNLAMLYYKQSKYMEAESLLRRALVISKQQVGLEHPYIQVIHENYNIVLEHLEQSAEVPEHISEEHQS